MSDIGLYGIASFIVGLAFVAAGVLLLLIAAIVSALEKARSGSWRNAAALGMVTSAILFVGFGGLAMFAGDQWPRRADDLIAFWGLGGFLLATLSGVITGTLTRKPKT